MKQVKRILSVLLVLAMVFSMLPASVQATEESQTTVDSGEVTVEGTNGFGNLLSEEITESQETTEEAAEGYEAGYSVTDLVIEGNTATVTYDTLETANLVVAIYTEDGLQLVTSGNAVVEPENTEATVTIDGTMPQYFMAAAYLLDTYDMSPLCAAYDTPMYTQEMQELLASTVNDYDADRVLNLDEDETTNFAVYADTTKVIEYVDGYNTVTTADDDTATYVVENADSQITSLAVGDIFAYAYGEDQILIVKVATITIDGTTVTITGDELEMEEVFSHVKVESGGTAADFTVDESTADEGVTFEGISDDSATYALRAGDTEISTSKSMEFVLNKEFKTGDTVEVSVKIGGSLKLKIKTSFSYYVSLTRQFLEYKTELSAKMSFGITGKVEAEIPLPNLSYVPFPGVSLGFTPNFKLTVSGKIEVSATLKTTVGVSYENGKGFQNLNSTPIVETEASVEVTVFIGLDLCPAVKVLGGEIIKLSVSVPVGFELKAKLTGTSIENAASDAESIHTCAECLEMELKFKIEFTVKLTFLKMIKLERELLAKEIKLTDMYWSLDHSELGLGPCPYVTYRVTVQVQDANYQPVGGVEVALSDGTKLGTTNGNGVVTTYLSVGEYTIKAIAGEDRLEKTFRVEEVCKIVLISDMAPSIESAVTGSVASETLKDYGNVVASGNCGAEGDNVTWKLYDNGLLRLTGTGAMADLSNNSYTTAAPWYVYADSIVMAQIGNGITTIGSGAFFDCSGLLSVTIPDDVTTIGHDAFRNCSSLTSITIPASVVSIDANAFFDCSSLASITIPDGVISISKQTFWGCSSLTSITIPENVTSIGRSAFVECSSLTSIIIPEGITIIDYATFALCTSLTSITIPDGVTSIGKQAFDGCSSLTSITIPDGVTSIGKLAFDDCSSLTSITIPSKVASIGDEVFSDCSDLAYIKFKGDAPAIGNYAFYNVTATAYYPAGNATWTEEVMQDYGGTITWVPYTPTETTEASVEESGTVTMTASASMVQAMSVFGGEYNTEVREEYILKTASFSDLVPGKDYVLLAMVSIEAEDLLAADNLLYIEQGTAGEDGTLVFQYVQRVTTDVSYVMACGASDQDLSNATITFPKMASDSETNAVNPTVVYDGETLVEGRDYVISGTVDYTAAGSYTCYIRGIYDYTGLVECTYTVDTVPSLAFKSASLTLQHNLAVDYKVDKALFEETGYTDPYVVFEIAGVQRTVTDYTVSGDRYVFRFSNIAPNKMNDTIYATLYASYGEKVYASAVQEYSIAKYCYNTLGKSTDAKLRTMLVDLLNYGAASQKYTDYNTDALVNADLTEEQKQWATATTPVLGSVQDPAYEVVENPAATWKSASLTLNDAVEVRVKFITDSIDGLSIQVRTDDEQWTISADEFVESDGVYYVDFDGLNAGQMRETLYLTICEGETAVSDTLRYSIETYAYKKQNVTDAYLGELMIAMMKYGDAAYAYAYE